MSRLLESLAIVGLRHPKRLLGLAALTLAICGIIGAGTPVDTSRNTMVSADNPHQAKQMRYFERFGIPQTLIFLVEGADAQSRRAAIDELRLAAAAVPQVEGRVLARVDAETTAELTLLHRPELGATFRQLDGGLVAALDRARGGLAVGTAGAPPPDPSRLQEGLRDLERLLRLVRTEATGGDGLAALVPSGEAEGVDDAGYLVTADGARHLVVLFPELPSDQARDVRPVVEALRAARDDVLSRHPGVTASLSGPPALAVDEEKQIQRGVATTSGVTGLGIVLLLLIAFRSLRYALLTLAPVAVGVSITMAVARGIYGELNMVTSSASSVLLALGIDFGVYLLTRYGEAVRKGAGAEEAVRGSVRRAGVGLFIGAITTALAFLTTTVTEFTAYARLGVVVTVGLVLTMLATLLWMPALLWVAGRGKALKAPELPGIARLPGLLRRGKGVVLAGAAVLFVVGLVQARGLHFNTRFYDFLPDEGESAAALLAIERDPVASPLVANVGVDDVAAARALASQLRDLDEVRSVRTPSDLVPPMDPDRLAALQHLGEAPDLSSPVDGPRLTAALRGLKQALVQLPGDGTATTVGHLDAIDEALRDGDALARVDALQRRLHRIVDRAWRTARAVGDRGRVIAADLPAPFRARYGALDGTGVSLAVVPAGDIWSPPVAARFAEAVGGVAPEATGLAMHVDAHLRMIRDGFTKAAVAAAVIVFLVLLAAFRRLGDALLAMVPPTVGFSWMLGTMASTGFDLDAANIIILPLIMGIGVDAGVHLVHRMRQSADEHDGVAALDEVVRGTGSAVLLASCTTAIGFASLTLAEYGAMTSLGGAMTLGVLTSLAASLLVLPSLMLLLRKAA